MKEGAVFKLMPLPEPPKLTQWKQHLRDKVVNASGLGEEAFAWVMVAEDMSVDISQLVVTSKFAAVDASLAAAFNDILRGRIGTIISDEKEKMATPSICRASGLRLTST